MIRTGLAAFLLLVGSVEVFIDIFEKLLDQAA